jgi:hypothetical protein
LETQEQIPYLALLPQLVAAVVVVAQAVPGIVVAMVVLVAVRDVFRRPHLVLEIRRAQAHHRAIMVAQLLEVGILCNRVAAGGHLKLAIQIQVARAVMALHLPSRVHP